LFVPVERGLRDLRVLRVWWNTPVCSRSVPSQRQLQDEAAAAAGMRLRRQFAAQRLRDALGHRQAQTDAAFAPPTRFRRTVKRLEDMRQIGRLDSLSAVL